MTTEQKILKQILENKRKASVQLIAKSLKMGNDYTRYICKELLRKGLIRKLKIRDWYEITREGRRELRRVDKSIKEYLPKGKIERKAAKKEAPKKKEASKKTVKKVVKKVATEVKSTVERKAGKKAKKKSEEETKKKVVQKIKTKTSVKKETKKKAKVSTKSYSRKKKAVKASPRKVQSKTPISLASHTASEREKMTSFKDSEIPKVDKQVISADSISFEPEKKMPPEEFKGKIEILKNLFRIRKD